MPSAEERTFIVSDKRSLVRPVYEGMAMPRDITGKDTNLAVRNLARRTGILPRNAAGRLALLEKSSFIDDENRVFVSKRLKRIAAHDIAQFIRLPTAAPQNGLLPPRARIARSLRPHPTRFPAFIAEQAI
jgi:hypothetical protein